MAVNLVEARILPVSIELIRLKGTLRRIVGGFFIGKFV